MPPRLLLFFLTFLLYFPALDYDFLTLDDEPYIVRNEAIRPGITLDTIRWAFQADLVHSSELTDWWIPVTHLSRLMDIEIFGFNPIGHHFTNIFLHCLNALLVYALLRRITHHPAASWIGAAVFAFHPMALESVVWIIERKDVLSQFFALLAIRAFLRFSARPSPAEYAALLSAFILSVLSKPMLVTLPVVLTILMFWPATPATRLKFLGLVPLYAISLLIGLNSLRVIESTSFDPVPPILHAEKVPVSYLVYLRRFVAPFDLAIHYPPPSEHYPAVVLAAALALPVLFTVAVWKQRNTRPYLLVGWSWFLLTLLPTTISPTPATANRFTYWPYLGLTIAATCAAKEWFSSGGRLRILVAGLFPLFLALLTARELPFWANTFTVFHRNLEVTGDRNYVAHGNLGTAYFELGRYDEAIYHLRRAVEISPKRPGAHFDLAVAFERNGDPELARRYYRSALDLDPRLSLALYNLGILSLKDGDHANAEACFRRVVEIDPLDHRAHYNIAETLFRQRLYGDALAIYREILRNRPDDWFIHINAAAASLGTGNPEDWSRHIDAAAVRAPTERFPGRRELVDGSIAAFLERVPDGAAAVEEMQSRFGSD